MRDYSEREFHELAVVPPSFDEIDGAGTVRVSNYAERESLRQRRTPPYYDLINLLWRGNSHDLAVVPPDGGMRRACLAVHRKTLVPRGTP